MACAAAARTSRGSAVRRVSAERGLAGMAASGRIASGRVILGQSLLCRFPNTSFLRQRRCQRLHESVAKQPHGGRLEPPARPHDVHRSAAQCVTRQHALELAALHE